MQTEENRSHHQKYIVIVGESSDTLKSLSNFLEQNGYEVSIDAEGSDILRQLVSTNPGVHLYLLAPQVMSTSPVVQKEKDEALSTRNLLHGDYTEIVGESSQLFKVFTQIEQVAHTDAKVHIYGETGTGKELVARALHRNSNRSGEAMVTVNCAAFPENLMEDELFGHEKGAFTGANTQRIGKFERAHKGTLFLDEIGAMPLSLQPKLLRVVEAGEIERIGAEKPIPVDVRIVSATNQNLQQAVENGMFREDLYYRLNVFSIFLPPLRERRQDIRCLAEHFLKKYNENSKQTHRKIALQTHILLQNYAWPGNVRELENAMKSAVIRAQGGDILPEHFLERIWTRQSRNLDLSGERQIPGAERTLSLPIGTSMKQIEKAFILNTLAEMDGNRTKTAAVLQISLRSLQNKLKTYSQREEVDKHRDLPL